MISCYQNTKIIFKNICKMGSSYGCTFTFSIMLCYLVFFLVACSKSNVSLTGAVKGNLELSIVDNQNETARSVKTVKSVTGGSLEIDFGYLPLDLIKDVKILVKNNGGYIVENISTTSLPDDNAINFKNMHYPGSGGTCETSLEIGQECFLVFEFAPTTSGEWHQRFLLNYKDGFSESFDQIKLKGVAGTKPELSIAADEDLDLGLAVVGDKLNYVFHLVNTGSLPALNFSVVEKRLGEINYKGGKFPGDGGSCTSTLQGKSSCSIVLEFNPISDKSHSFTLSFMYNDFEDTKVYNATFLSRSVDVKAEINFDKILSIDFGKHTLEKKEIRTVTVVNTGYVNAKDFVFKFDNDNFVLSNNRCPVSLMAGARCEIDLQYFPHTTGAHSGSLEIEYFNGKTIVNGQTLLLKGKGILPAIINTKINNVVSNQHDFGLIGQNDSVEVLIIATNQGEYKASSLLLSNLQEPFSISQNTCQEELAVGASCNIKLIFHPTAVGTFHEQLGINYHNGTSVVTNDLIFAGTSEAFGVIKFQNLSTFNPYVMFGNVIVGDSIDKSVTIKNIGVVAATNIVLPSLPGALVYKMDTCSSSPFSLNADESCSFTITYSPIITSEIDAQNLLITYDTAGRSLSKSFSITGLAKNAAQILFVDGPEPYTEISDLNFEKVSVGYDKYLPIRLYNAGEFDAVDISPKINTGTKFFINGILPTMNGQMIEGTCEPQSETDPDRMKIFNIPAGGSCYIFIKFTATELGEFSESLQLSYNNGSATQKVDSLILKGEGAELAHLSFTPDQDKPYIKMPDTATGGGVGYVDMELKNDGQYKLTNLLWGGLSGQFNFDTNKTTCLNELEVGETCVLSVSFAPSSLGSSSDSGYIKYYDGYQNISLTVRFLGEGVKPANLYISSPSGSTPYNLGDAAVDSERIVTIKFTNKGARYAHIKSLTLDNANFVQVLSSDSCVADYLVNTSQSCYLRFSITPTPAMISTKPQANVSLQYNNGLTDISISFKFYIFVLAPTSVHKGWTRVNAVGDVVDINNLKKANKFIKLQWEEMIPKAGYIISSYQVFRKNLSTEEFNYDLPLAVGLDKTQRIFIDSNVESGKKYYYQVLPVISGGVSKVGESFSVIDVIAPPPNMAFIHRWMANKEICSKLGSISEKDNGYICDYLGIGSVYGRFDMDKHLLVDIFEIGVQGNSKAGQLARNNLTQNAAWNICLQMKENIFGTEKTKRLITKKEQTISSLWNVNDLSGLTINEVERGVLGSENCNGSSSTIENNDSNSKCVSLFGIYNMAGNVMEWTSERLINGVGASLANQKLNPDIYDLDGISFLNHLTGNSTKDNCYNYVVGMPMKFDQGVCTNGNVLSSAIDVSSGITDDYFWGPSFFQVSLAGAVTGGASSSSMYSGVATTAWVDATTFTAGARCVIEIAP